MDTPQQPRKTTLRTILFLGALCLGALPLLATPQTAIGKSGSAYKTPFDPLMPLYKQIQSVMEQMLQGPIKSAKPFTLHKSAHKNLSKRKQARRQKMYKELAMIAGPQIGWMAFEYEMTLMDGKEPRLHVRWILGHTKAGWRIVELSHYNRSRTNKPRGIKMDQLQGASKPMALAGRRVLKALTQKGCYKLPIISPKEVPVRLPKRLSRSMFRSLKRTQTRLNTLCKKTTQMKFSDAYIRVDDVIGFITNKKDEMKGGIKIEWRLRPKGELVVGPPRFRKFR